MKRRKTVSVTPAMGARTVAGEMVTVPMARLAGTGRTGAAGRKRVSAPHVAELSQNFFMTVEERPSAAEAARSLLRLRHD